MISFAGRLLILLVDANTLPSVNAGMFGTVHFASDAETVPSESAVLPQSGQSLMCDKTCSTRSADNSPSRKAITSSGATGCVLVLIGDTLSARWDRRRVGPNLQTWLPLL